MQNAQNAHVRALMDVPSPRVPAPFALHARSAPPTTPARVVIIPSCPCALVHPLLCIGTLQRSCSQMEMSGARMLPAASMYTGVVSHVRWSPSRHAFAYRVSLAFLDLQVRRMCGVCGTCGVRVMCTAHAGLVCVPCRTCARARTQCKPRALERVATPVHATCMYLCVHARVRECECAHVLCVTRLACVRLRGWAGCSGWMTYFAVCGHWLA